jgi:hypothetical protein
MLQSHSIHIAVGLSSVASPQAGMPFWRESDKFQTAFSTDFYAKFGAALNRQAQRDKAIVRVANEL